MQKQNKIQWPLIPNQNITEREIMSFGDLLYCCILVIIKYSQNIEVVILKNKLNSRFGEINSCRLHEYSVFMRLQSIQSHNAPLNGWNGVMCLQINIFCVWGSCVCMLKSSPPDKPKCCILPAEHRCIESAKIRNKYPDRVPVSGLHSSPLEEDRGPVAFAFH